MSTTEETEERDAAERDAAEREDERGEPAAEGRWWGRLRRAGRVRGVRARAVRARGARAGRRTAAGAVVGALLLAAGGFAYRAHELRDPAATGNRALTDTAATSQVTGDVSSALSTVFAYTPQDIGSTAAAARRLLDGAASTQYQALFAQIRRHVAEQQLTLTTRVVRAGVVSLGHDRARLLVFLDQTAVRPGATATSAAAQLSVTARLDHGRWRITDLKAR